VGKVVSGITLVTMGVFKVRVKEEKKSDLLLQKSQRDH